MLAPKSFGSDNHAPVHPKIMQALFDINFGSAPSYGTDACSEEALELFRQQFGRQAEVFFVFNGTAANVLALRPLLQTYESVACSDCSHLALDECGAPEFILGNKLILLPSYQGKILLADLKKSYIRRGDQHFSQLKVLSLTQPTELGTCYSLAELKEIITWAKNQQMYIHIDGARLVHAACYLQKTLSEITTDLGVDVVSFGGTKNGLMFGEAIVFLNPQMAKNFKFHRKQMGQLPSKTRYMAAQFLAFFKDNLWQEISAHSLSMAQYLAQKTVKQTWIPVVYPVQSNSVFVQLPKPLIKSLRKKYFFYVWDEQQTICRWMTSWNTTASDIDEFIEECKGLDPDFNQRKQ